MWNRSLTSCVVTFSSLFHLPCRTTGQIKLGVTHGPTTIPIVLGCRTTIHSSTNCLKTAHLDRLLRAHFSSTSWPRKTSSSNANWCAKKIFLLVYLTPSTSPRISEMADYKNRNSTQERNMFHHDYAIWFFNQWVKYESLTKKKESLIASKVFPQVKKSLEIYFLLVWPLEKKLIYHLFKDDDQKQAYQLYFEYMWIWSGMKRTVKDLF